MHISTSVHVPSTLIQRDQSIRSNFSNLKSDSEGALTKAPEETSKISNNPPSNTKVESEVVLTQEMKDAIRKQHPDFATRELVGDKEWALLIMGSANGEHWLQAGIEVTDEQWHEIADIAEQEFCGNLRQAIQQNAQTSSLTFNHHQIFIDADVDLPDWFFEEYEETVSIIEKDSPEMAMAFRSGARSYSMDSSTNRDHFDLIRQMAQYR